jgi:hypothetical protein
MKGRKRKEKKRKEKKRKEKKGELRVNSTLTGRSHQRKERKEEL